MDVWSFVQSLPEDYLRTVVEDNPHWETSDSDSLRLGLASRLNDMFDWPVRTKVPLSSTDLALSGNYCLGFLVHLTTYSEHLNTPVITVEAGDVQRIRKVLLAHGFSQEVQHPDWEKRFGWVASRWRVRFSPEDESIRNVAACMWAVADEFYPRHGTRALAVAGLLGTVGLVAAGVAVHRSRKAKAVHRPRRTFSRR